MTGVPGLLGCRRAVVPAARRGARSVARVLLARSPLAWLLIGLVEIYRRVLGPPLAALTGPRCRFEPSCSSYAAVAVREHGGVLGGWLALRRLLRCQPWGGCGYDPVPPRPAARATAATPSTISVTSARTPIPTLAAGRQP